MVNQNLSKHSVKLLSQFVSAEKYIADLAT